LGLGERAREKALTLFDDNQLLEFPTFGSHLWHFRSSSKRKHLLWYLADFGSEELFAYGLEHLDIDNDIRATSLESALLQAVQKGHFSLVKMLITTYKVNIYQRTRDSNNAPTPLIERIDRGHFDIVELLLNKTDIDVNVKGEDDASPLMRASIKGNEDVVRLLLSTDKVHIDAQDKGGLSALLLAVD
jgi:ankyrin repeat protein